MEISELSCLHPYRAKIVYSEGEDSECNEDSITPLPKQVMITKLEVYNSHTVFSNLFHVPESSLITTK